MKATIDAWELALWLALAELEAQPAAVREALATYEAAQGAVRAARDTHEAAEKLCEEAFLELLRLRVRVAPAPALLLPCGWGAKDCEHEARHLVRVRFRSGPVPMCLNCASIFDPVLGADSGYRHDFVERIAIERPEGIA